MLTQRQGTPTSRVQLALHALEPKTVVLGCHIHGFPQRLRRCTHLLPPFAMCAALPRSDYGIVTQKEEVLDATEVDATARANPLAD